MTEEFNESMINDIKEGDKVTGEVQQVEDKQVVVHINGGKFNGIIPISQLSTHHIDSPSEVVKEATKLKHMSLKLSLMKKMKLELTSYLEDNLKLRSLIVIYKKN